ncbi:hypothetical protein BC628DRAFT_1416416 [Trametes gibbosa]|nr:hypothetical protein BC628DRAFT_1416416 [Trametes gibbosa]
MDAFFTIAAPVPVEAPVETTPVDQDDVGTVGNHGSCTIAWGLRPSAHHELFAPFVPGASPA